MTTTKPRILFLEDDLRLRKALAEEFRERGFETFEGADSGALPRTPMDYAVIDLRLGRENGLHLLEAVKKKYPACRVVMLTGYGSIATAVEAMKLGAYHYLTKPVSVETLEATLKGAAPSAGPAEMPATTLSRHEHEYIEFVLTQNEGNISRTAKQLGIHRQSLQRKLRKLP